MKSCIFIIITITLYSCAKKNKIVVFDAIEDDGCFVYVSSSIGDDENEGGVKSPVKTIKRGFELGDSIRLKAGDVFISDGTLVLDGQYLGKYGQGNNPVISGFMRPINQQWMNQGGNIWSLNLAKGFFSGVQNNGSSLLNNIGCLFEYDKDSIHGYRVRYKEELKQNWDYWQTGNNSKSISAEEFDILFLYYDGDPNSLKIEFSTGLVALKITNSQVDGVDFVGFGFGISAMSGTIIRNSRLDVLGGMLMIGYSEFGCYGNGIEFYVWKDIQDCLIENCTISRCYDAACTIQAYGCGDATPRNIHFKNNLLYNNCQGWEDYLRNNNEVKYENCTFENNVVLNSGETGWRYPSDRFKFCHVLGNNTKGDKGMIIRNNLFVGGNFYCSGSYNNFYRSNVWEGNVCYIRRGDFLIGDYLGLKDVVRVPTDKGIYANIDEATKAALKTFRSLSGDSTTKFEIVDNNTIKQMINSEKNKHQRKSL